MNKHHQTLLTEIKKQKGRGNSQSGKDSYMLSGHFYYDISVPVRRGLVKEWLKMHTKLTPQELISLLDSLYKGDSHEEKSVASMLLAIHPEIRKNIPLTKIDNWLSELSGWAEIDGMCQSIFKAEELLSKWTAWKSFIQKLSKDKNINKRRASIVFLTGPVAQSADRKLLDLSFEMIEKLKHEKPILITRAISWLLRSGVKHHKKEIAEYIKINKDSLPKIAIREASRKIKTGRK